MTAVDRLREFAFGGVVAVVAALSLVVSPHLGVLVLAAAAALLLVFRFLTRDRVPASRVEGRKVYWRTRGGRPRMVKVVRVEPVEPEYAFVELDDGDTTIAWTADLSLPLAARLKYSWRRRG